MADIRQREIFVERVLYERDRFEQLLNRVGYARRMTLKGVAGKRSVKDVLAHIWAYEQFLADRMAEIQNGQPYAPGRTQSALDAFVNEFGYPDFGSPLLDADAPGEWVVERYRHVSLDDLVAQEIEAFCAIVSVLETMPEELVIRHNLYNRIARHTFERYRDHAREIRRWLRVNGVQLK